MKAKKLALLGIIGAAIGITFLFHGTSVHADTPTDQKAAKYINDCKEALGPTYSPECSTYHTCVTSTTVTGLLTPGSLCAAIVRLNDQVPGASEDPTKVNCDTVPTGPAQDRCKTLKSCIGAGQTANACFTGYAQCAALNPGNIPGCATLVAKGDVTGANKKLPDPNSKKSTCQIVGIGWIVCPVMNFLSEVVDGAYTIVSALLQVQPLLTTNQTKSIYDAWTYMRTFANVAFVIAFLLIIFSQLSNVGISNYGIKKMLPRLIVAAILVNVSYWICAIAVDASNILGSTIGDLFASLKAQLALPDSHISSASTGEGWVGITGGILAGTAAVGAALYVGLSALLPILITALFAIIMTVIILALRQALIILLVIVSPLAFVAYLLPNTEYLFKEWRKLLQTLLILYPTISLIFGASALASQLVMSSATGDNGIKLAVQVMGAGISIVPLLLVPIVMKAAASAMKIGGIANNPNKGPFDRMKKGAAGYRANRQDYRSQKALNGVRTLPGRGRAEQHSTRREAVLNNRKSELSRAKSAYVAGVATNDPGFRKQLARGDGGGADMRALAGAVSTQVELESKEIKAATAVIEHMNLSSNDLQSLARGNEVTKDGRTLLGSDDATRKAAMMSAVSTGTVDDVEKLLTDSEDRTESQNKVLSSALASSGIANKATHLGGQTLDDVAQGKVTNEADLDRVTARTIEKGKYSAEKLADNDPKSLERIERVLSQGRSDISTTQAANIKVVAAKAATDDRIKGRLSEAQKPIINRLR